MEQARPLPEIGVAFQPEDKGVESLARQIRLTGRAYPIFEIGHLILKKPDRYQVTFSVLKKPDGQVAQALWFCNLDETLWLSEQEAVDHVLEKHFETFYKAEKTPTEPPHGAMAAGVFAKRSPTSPRSARCSTGWPAAPQ